ncbi:alpha/beta hydrolase [Hymenobacter sp. BT664]|uniref:Alpha/beta hydrolase n=1 Tax=Hymenobacter montanus TaxID=2771359 RepID=A0A927GLR3_9BACT|nr:alpha/beta hydrolase [Hymenobacter montanus]MBD2770441.1 alpha/beta hydrolase [Hymenobacter montanus]
MLNSKWVDNLLLSVKKGALLKHKNEVSAGHEFIELSNSIIRYKIVGSGAKTIAFVPDPPNVIEHYEVLADLLKDEYKVVLFELPGLGFSLPTKLNFDYSLVSYADIAAELLQKLNLGPTILAFPCVWGYVAVKVAEKHPALVEGIITMQAPAWEHELAWAKKIDTYNLVNKPLVGQLVMFLADKWVARKWYDYALPKHKYDAKFYQLSAKKLRQGGCFCLASLTQGLFHQKTQPTFIKVDAPAITIWGDLDRSHKRSDPNSSTSFFSNAQVHHFEGCGHFPELESPKEFVQVLKKWQAAQA